jgi:outer membrane lipoprotein-sorting protein
MRHVFYIFLVLAAAGHLYAADETAPASPPADEKKAPEAADLTDVQKIVEKANLVAYYQGKDGSAKVDMTITDKEGRQRRRQFNILRKNTDGGDQMYYVYFLEPADVRRMVFMVHKHIAEDKDDDRWLYLPSLDLVKRIAASDKRTSFVGSDYLYEDVSGRSLLEDEHKLVGTDDTFYTVENTPKRPDTVEFSRFVVKIDKKTFMPTKMDFFDKQGRLYRQIEVLEVQEIQGYPTSPKSIVKDHNSGSTTEMVFSDVKYDMGLGDIFTERYLRRPPREAR